MATAKPPNSNLFKEEREAIKTFNLAIKKKEVLILAQDKGMDIALVNPSTYSDKLTKMVVHPDIEEKDKTM